MLKIANAAIVAALFGMLAGCNNPAPSPAPTDPPGDIARIRLAPASSTISGAGNVNAVIQGGTLTFCLPNAPTQCTTINVVAQPTNAPTIAPSPTYAPCDPLTPNYPCVIESEPPAPVQTTSPIATVVPTLQPTATPVLPTLAPTAPSTIAPTTPPTSAPTAAPTTTAAAGAIIFNPANLYFASASAAAQVVFITQSNSSNESFVAGNPSGNGSASYTHGTIENSLLVSPKSVGNVQIPITGANGVVGYLSVGVGASPTSAPTAAPTLQPTTKPILRPTPAPIIAPSVQPTNIATVPPVILNVPQTSVTVGQSLLIAISQGTYQGAFSATSSNPNVASVSVSGNVATVKALSPGQTSINVVGFGGQTASIHAKF